MGIGKGQGRGWAKGRARKLVDGPAVRRRSVGLSEADGERLKQLMARWGCDESDAIRRALALAVVTNDPETES